MKNSKHLAGMLLAMSAMYDPAVENTLIQQNSESEEPKKSYRQLEYERAVKKERDKRIVLIDKKIQKYGLKPFKFGNTVIFARNIENATRKAKNQGLI